MLRGKVICILSGREYPDGQRRYEIQFDSCEAMFRRIRVPEGLINTTRTLQLDDEIVLEVVDTGANPATRARIVKEFNERAAGAAAESATWAKEVEDAKRKLAGRHES